MEMLRQEMQPFGVNVAIIEPGQSPRRSGIRGSRARRRCAPPWATKSTGSTASASMRLRAWQRRPAPGSAAAGGRRGRHARAHGRPAKDSLRRRARCQGPACHECRPARPGARPPDRPAHARLATANTSLLPHSMAMPGEEFTDIGEGITLCHDSFGDPSDQPMLLIMGLGTQMIAWREDFCEQLASRGFYVVRFDNRDAGLSTHVTGPPPTLRQMFTRKLPESAYSLEDMADDTLRLTEALNLGPVHVVGASMGGMIGQVLAARHPDQRALARLDHVEHRLALDRPARAWRLSALLERGARGARGVRRPRDGALPWSAPATTCSTRSTSAT